MLDIFNLVDTLLNSEYGALQSADVMLSLFLNLFFLTGIVKSHGSEQLVSSFI